MVVDTVFLTFTLIAICVFHYSNAEGGINEKYKIEMRYFKSNSAPLHAGTSTVAWGNGEGVTKW